jgi:hypothetical protein
MSDYSAIGVTHEKPDHDARSAHIQETVIDLIRNGNNVWEVMTNLQSGLDLVFASLTWRERVQNLGGELLLAIIYIAFLGLFAVGHLASLGGLVHHLVAFIFPPAFADDKSFQSPAAIKIAILTGYSFALMVILIMSAYAAMLRKPPLQSAKDILKIILGFVTGQLTLAGFLT